MKIYGKDLEKDFLLIAEIGVNHEGNFDKARQLLQLAAKAEADVVKFQCYSPDRYISRDNPERRERVGRFSLTTDQLRILQRDAEEAGIGFLSTPVTEDLVDLHAALCPAIKIASGDMTFEPTVRAAARSQKPLIVSTGLARVDEIDQTVQWIEDEIQGASLKDRLVLLHCVSSYPTPTDQANLLSIPFLRDRYGVHVGYSNHVIASEICLAAKALGAAIIEVHFTDCRTGRDFHDHSLSFEADELKSLRSALENVHKSLGSFGKEPQACEVGNIPLARKGLVAARDLPAGHVISRDDLAFARPATEFASGDIARLIGKETLEDIPRWSSIVKSVIKD